MFVLTDPTYMIRAVPSIASDNVYCTLLAQSVVHGTMAGYTGFTSGLVNGRQTYIPFYVRMVNEYISAFELRFLSVWGTRAILHLTPILCCFLLLQRITEKQNKVVITDRMWARLLSSTNQPSFWSPKDEIKVKREEEPPKELLDDQICTKVDLVGIGKETG